MIYIGVRAPDLDPTKFVLNVIMPYHTIPYHTYHMRLWFTSRPSLLNAPLRSQSVPNASKCFPNVWRRSKCSQTFPISLYAYAYLHTYRTIPPIRFPNARNAFKRFYNALRRSTTLPNVPKLSLCFAYLHTVPYNTIWDYAYHATIHTTKTIHTG